MALQIVVGWPPNIKEIRKAFDLTGKKPCFAWGGYIFNPYNSPIDEAVANHEATHSIQQDGIGPVKWWKKYIADPAFRLEQEIPAYQNQYVKFCERVHDGNKRAKYAYYLALDMASPMYGGMIKFSDALTLIKNGN